MQRPGHDASVRVGFESEQEVQGRCEAGVVVVVASLSLTPCVHGWAVEEDEGTFRYGPQVPCPPPPAV